MSMILGCTDGMTLEQAASIGVGFCALVCGAALTGLMAWWTWLAWTVPEDADENEENQEREAAE